MKIGYDAKRAFHNSRGLGNYSRDCVRIVSERLHPAQLYLFNPKKSKGYAQLLQLKNTVEVLPSGWWKNVSGLWRTWGVSRQAKQLHLDLYHGLSGEIPVGMFRNVPTIVTIHDLIFLRYPELYSFWDRVIHTAKFKYAAQNAHHIIAISEQTKKDIIRYFGICEEKISVVYQGCHQVFKQEYSLEQKQKVREKYNLFSPYVLNVGAIEPRKNALSIVKAIEHLDISLVLIGQETSYAQQIKDYIRQKNMENRVVFLKGVSMEELSIIYQMSEVFCYPSVFEGFGIPIIEALFSKTPVITTKGYCFEEAGGASSLYIDLDDDVNQIKQHIVDLQNHPEKRQKIVSQGFDFVQKFTDDKVFASLMEVYQRVVSAN